MKRVKLRRVAQSDIEDAFLWYEQQQAGLGDSFVANLDEVIDSIPERPEASAVVQTTFGVCD